MPDRGVGDLMWHLPTVRAIAATTTEDSVVLAARPTTRAAGLLATEPSVSQVAELVYHRGALRNLREMADFYRLCRRLRPRAVWILEKIGRPAQAAALAGVPVRHGFGLGHASQERWLSPGPRLPKSMRPRHRIEKLAAFEALHGLTVASREPALRVDPRQVDAIAARFADRPKPWVVFGLGSVDAHRRWPPGHFAGLADALHGWAGTIFWLGGPDEHGMIAAGMQGLIHPEDSVLSSDLKLDAAAALMAQSAVFLGNDSGPMNLAAAVGIPTVGLYGASQPLTYSRWLSALTSPTGDLKDIAPEQAAEAVRQALSAPLPSSRPTAPN